MPIALNTVLILLLSINSFSQNNIIKIAESYLSKDFNNLLFVSIENQKLYHIKKNTVVNSFIISSSEYGIGNRSGSNKTPIGLHRVKQKYGKNTPINGRLTGRVFYGEISKIYKDTTRSQTDDITSRILWLEGMEAGINKGKGIDSYERYIYIHGTSEEGRLGTPSSHGCIRMRNKDIINLYKTVEVGTLVLIL